MMLILFLMLTYASMTGVGMALLWRYRRASPIFWFPGALALMALGTFPLVDTNLPSDRLYIVLMYLAHVAFLVSALVATSAVKLDRALEEFAARTARSPSAEEISVCVAILIVSALVSIVYYYLVGYNIIVMFFEGNIYEDYSDLRLAAYSGNEYFAPGYVNQFKNVLLPLTAVIVGMRLWERRRMDLFIPFVAVAFPGVIIALAGTGQRAYLVYTLAALAFGYFLHLSGRASKVNWRPIILAGLPLAALFVGLTQVYSESSGLGEAIASTFSRFTRIQQEGGLFAFQYIYRLPTTWFGEWWQNVKGIAPGVEGSRIAHDVHAMLYGSDRGTVPLTSIGSAYYNGGVGGVMLLFVVLGIVYTLIYRRYLSGDRSYVRSFSYGFAFFYLSINVTDAPTILLENGVLTILLFILILRIARGGGGQRFRARHTKSAVART